MGGEDGKIVLFLAVPTVILSRRSGGVHVVSCMFCILLKKKEKEIKLFITKKYIFQNVSSLFSAFSLIIK